MDHRLINDTFPVGSLQLCEVLLMNNRNYPWLILVPKPDNIVELIDLSTQEQSILMAEIALVSRVMKEMFQPYKLNIATLGNIVRQLHIHIIARNQDDPAWPNPVWNSGVPAQYYENNEQCQIINSIASRL